MTETRLERFRRDREELVAKIRDLDTEIGRLSSGEPPSPKLIPPDQVDVALYRSWSEDERGAFYAQHPALAAQLKEGWAQALKKERSLR